MKFKFRNNKFILAFILMQIILFFLSSADLYAGSKPEKKIKHWEADISISPYYDSNILKYSDKYIQRFLNRQDEGRFQINRYDDLVTGYSAGLSYSNQFIKKLNSTFSFNLGYSRYSFNPVKNWVRYSIGWKQNFLSGSTFMLSYSYIPHFYVRHFRDEDWAAVYGYIPLTFKAYEFAKDDFSLWIQHNLFKNTRIKGYLSLYKYYLDPNNTEYDSNDYLIGIRLYQQITKNLNVNAGYKYVYSDAKGYDQPGESKGNSDDVNATNYGHNFLAGLNYSLPPLLNLNSSISLDIAYERCFYTTKQYYEIDPIHAGRNDKNYDITVTYNINLPGNVGMSGFYNLMGRKTGTPVTVNAEYISDEKSYEQYQAGIEINYSFNF